MNRIITHQSSQDGKRGDSFEKGRLFEEYIIKLFNERHFSLQEWRKSEKRTGFIPFTHSFPDLELIFMGKMNHRFAIECKWKQEFKNGKIEWAEEKKIRVYKQFQKEKRMIVFIAIGIGGEPSNPEKLFVTPLDKICMHCEVYESDLLKYNHKPTRRFFYDTVQLRLW
jgi:hypothetical protein